MGITSISRSKTPRVSRITPREWLVAASGGLTLAYTAWGLGGIPAWSLHMLLAGGLTTLTLALCPLLRREQGAGSREQTL